MRYHRFTVVFVIALLVPTSLIKMHSYISESGWYKPNVWIQLQQEDAFMQSSRSPKESHVDKQATEREPAAVVAKSSTIAQTMLSMESSGNTELRLSSSRTQGELSLKMVGQSAVTILSESTPKTATTASATVKADNSDTPSEPSLGTAGHSTESTVMSSHETLKIYTKPKVISKQTMPQTSKDGHSFSAKVDNTGVKAHDKDPITVLGKVPEQHPILSSSKIFMSLKTSSVTEDKRLPPMLLTWMQTVEQRQIHIVTDAPSHWTEVAQALGFEITLAECPPNHKQSSLCCKSGKEYELYYAARAHGEDYNWYCHFDDDVYVNVPLLADFLNKYNGKDKLYFGHYPATLRRNRPVALRSKALTIYPEYTGKPYKYATGAAYCISWSLMEELQLYLRDSATYMDTCNRKLFTTDDMAVGAVIELFLGYKLTEVPAMQSHVEKLGKINPNQLKDMITVGYSLSESGDNIINIPNGTFSIENDPTRFLSYHCLLYKSTSWCP